MDDVFIKFDCAPDGDTSKCTVCMGWQLSVTTGNENGPWNAIDEGTDSYTQPECRDGNWVPFHYQYDGLMANKYYQLILAYKAPGAGEAGCDNLNNYGIFQTTVFLTQ